MGVEMKALPSSYDEKLSSKVLKYSKKRVAKLPASKVICKSRNDHSKAASAYWHSFDDRPSEDDEEPERKRKEESSSESAKESKKSEEVVEKKAASKS